MTQNQTILKPVASRWRPEFLQRACEISAEYGNDYMSKRILSQFEETDVGASYQWDAVFVDGD